MGSNWLSDSLRSVMPQHNEPFRQQLGREHPLSPRNRVAVDLDGTGLDGLGQHHLACALSDLYGRPRHLVKETNLFFATDTALGLLPHSPVLILTRAPIGIASSFARGRLWERWRYGERYAQVAATARSPRWRDEFAPLLPQDNPEEAVALARLIAVNTLLLARAVHRDLAGCGRDCTVVSYEQHVSDRKAALSALAGQLKITLQVADAPRPAEDLAGMAAADPTFATTGHKDKLVAELDSRTAELMPHHTAATMARAGELLDAQVTATATEWLAGDDLYEVRDLAPCRRAAVRTPSPAQALPASAYYPVKKVSWRNLLVTNAEMADLLTMLHAAGAPNTRLGTNLLVCPMPHERGGRLHFDAGRRVWRVSPGYESHPAYWVTWAGAAAMAAWLGARLPTRAEALEATAGARAYNCDYAVGDASSVAEPGHSLHQIHHLVGNLQIWCGDGSDQPVAEPVQRYLFGAAWNTPGSEEAIGAVRSRNLLGSSRGVGVRLVRDSRTTATSGLGAWELANRLNRWTDTLEGGTGRPLGELDRLLTSALAGPDDS
ncbi:SUMF1/EgtB/PvdO family nonheme iron enzyme [Streptomyces sp. NPDC059743]|uniref:SUMF1/EgtB/PvdO family nonheme iron enzyme n=1 Tax=Streptomyces sp. NPDC059743 TaxID=3346928 RepID=UPI00365B1C41